MAQPPLPSCLVYSLILLLCSVLWCRPVEGAMVARALGGCGIHNAMLYVRALEEDFKVPSPLYYEIYIEDL